MTIDSDLGRLGVSLSRLLRAVAVLDGWIDAGIVGAVSAVIMRRGFVVRTYARGHYGPGNSGLNIDSNSLFHLASIGKPMAACAVTRMCRHHGTSPAEPHLRIAARPRSERFAAWHRDGRRNRNVSQVGTGRPDGQQGRVQQCRIWSVGHHHSSGEWIQLR
jgi:hypothetical protein